VSLGPLTVEDLADEHPEADLPAVIDATGGIPLLVQEALTTGEISPESSSVLEYIESRRRRLSDLSGQVLAAASVLSGMCDPGLLRETSGRTEEEVVEAVEELVGSGLLKELDDDRLGFTLDVLERVTYESTSLIRRRLLHRRAAEALQARARTRHDARLTAATAGHLRMAGSDEASEWYRRAGDLAREVRAGEEARLAYETAIALGHPEVGALRLALGEIAITSGDYDLAAQELQSAAAQSAGPTLAVVEHRIGELNRLLGRFDLAEESFARAEPGHPHPSDLYADWALLRHRVGDPEGAIELAEKAVTEATTDVERARALNVSGLVSTDPNQALARIEQALAVSGPLDPARMAALNNKAHLLATSGDYEGATALVEEAIGIAEQTGYRHHRAALLNHLADLHHRSGRRAEAEQALTEAVTIFADIDSGDWRPEVWLLRQW
jgi:tetratricopeptide (TPR) repeat protein